MAALETSKCYLKIGYLHNCSINNETISHCIAHVLSDPENEYLSKACHSMSCHESMCTQCDILFEVINSILSITANLDIIEKQMCYMMLLWLKITFLNGYSILLTMPNKTKQNKIV